MQFLRVFLSKEQASEAIDKISISPSVKRLSEIYDRAKSNIDKDLKKYRILSNQ